jgi:hypothetical protein
VKERALALLNQGIDRLQVTFPPNRIVILLTPLVFAPAAGWVSAYVAQHFPALNLDSTAVMGVFIAGAISAVTLAYKYVDGWQKLEADDRR